MEIDILVENIELVGDSVIISNSQNLQPRVW